MGATIAEVGWRRSEEVALDEARCRAIIIFTSVAPSKDSEVRSHFDDLLLQTMKRLLALPVERRHTDVENPEETIRFVLHAGGPPTRGPRHALRYADG